jgi:multicomponent Na+:H+ antiporter subunit C
MTQTLIYSLTGVILFAVGLFGVLITAHILRKILSINVMGVGIFMLLIAIAKQEGGTVDSLPHALVLTGIVVAVAGTALALSLVIRIQGFDQAQVHDQGDEK